MGLLDILKGKKNQPAQDTDSNTAATASEPSEPECEPWPDCEHWSAMRDGHSHSDGDSRFDLSLVRCGSLQVPSGRLVVCDPFAFMMPEDNPAVDIPPGEYPVVVTLAALKNEAGEVTQYREAYASLLIEDSEEVRRQFIPLLGPNEDPPEPKPGEYTGFCVDAGTACFVDQQSLTRGMPDGSTWHEDLFENDRSDCWFARMDDPNHIRDGIANIPLPKDPSVNLILFHSGWGDGVFPVVGGYNAADNLVAVHIDFHVAPCS
jgi:hypothetical protein